MSIQEFPVELLMLNTSRTPNDIWLRQPTNEGELTFTWGQAAEEVGRIAAALRAMNLPSGSSIAISGRNSIHWFLADFAIAMAGHVSVGLYPKQSRASTEYILDHCEARAIFIGPSIDLADLQAAVPSNITKIAMPYDEVVDCDFRWQDLIAEHAPITEYDRPDPDSLMTLVYTSGTTGNPKGVMMSYRNFQFASGAFLKWFPSNGQEQLLSYLPLAHLMERVCIEMGSLIWRAKVFFVSDIDKLGEQLRGVAPTRFFGVPLIYSRMHGDIIKSIPQKKLEQLMRVPVVRGILRRKILTTIGFQNVRSCISGAAPIPVSTMRFFREILGIELLEGYGMSENMAYLSACIPGEVRIGSVGKPFPDADVRIAEDNEIQCRHQGCTVGYFKEPEKTLQIFTEDGYLRTGDKGRLDEDGFLYIIGRVKDIFKTAKGKYVSPAPIEGAFSRDNIDQLCLVGMNLTQPIMVVTLTADARRKVRHDLESELLADIAIVNESLESHEKVAKLLIVPDCWQPDNGFMTPTLKVKRNIVEERYREVILQASSDRKNFIVWSKIE